jgi:acyl-coenzyme A synthetase/AMP-(fatty) acid ligase
MVDLHKINQFYTAPTAIRALRRLGNEPVQKASLESLRVLGSVGEPINPEAWQWYYEVVGRKKCTIVDTYWQTETVLLLNLRLGFNHHYSITRGGSIEAWGCYPAFLWN